ncbi:hypothetical protein [Capnocytophaga leadbetteri]
MKKANLTRVQLLQNSLVLILSSIAREERELLEAIEEKHTQTTSGK